MGQYVYLAATGPGLDLYYLESGGWTTDQTLAQVFPSVIDAQETGIFGLPPGYHTKLVQALVTVLPQEAEPIPCTPQIY